MKKWLIIVLVISSIIALGFIIGFFIPDSSWCTEMFCGCVGVSGELPCNSCGSSNPIFVIGIVNIGQVCSAKEILTCENDTQVNRKIEETKDCKIMIVWISDLLGNRQGSYQVSELPGS